MIRIAGERIRELFALAESESRRRPPGLSDRYVQLARRVGTRYNVRIPPEFSELYCRGCSSFWVEGRTVRTRLRSGRRTRLCLICGRRRRTGLLGLRPSVGLPIEPESGRDLREAAVLVDDALEEDDGDHLADEAEE